MMLTLESDFTTDLGMDGLDHVELIMNVEKEFGVTISDVDAVQMQRPADIVRYLEARADGSKYAVRE
ncbi:unnamed protein product [Darwinula stevensoni]|uniref:Acyl carrier protein n=1 Tax=Darwinula stevensoni TaxID=69355 RepID=A0A7R9A7J9_9CRUS|nr:unnamed protein product [Darwinula stevensoni]CAG0893726.1 unnamed protein product [Darwinula stevensoni]